MEIGDGQMEGKMKYWLKGERDNDDETSAGQHRATGWIEVKLIGLRELWRVKRGRESETERLGSRWVHPNTLS